MSKLGMITTLLATGLEEAVKKDGGSGLGEYVKNWIKTIAENFTDLSGNEEIQLRPIETAPMNGTYIVIYGPSGYTGTPLHSSVGKFDPEYRPYWVTHSGDAFSDCGGEATYWHPLPVIPKTSNVKVDVDTSW
jgi:hypothetical protein